MSDTIIKAEGIGKRYRIRHQRPERYTALRDVIAERVRHVFWPAQVETAQLPAVEDFWALKNISFEVKRGEIIGIIGRNGAGKSTLLKVLSRITEPTAGRVVLNGRVASLLEVGTGFHPELTGRENIYLNGAILGMERSELRQKFDSIVDFSGVEKFLDTPVKRYSSGMYVRLGFAVAAYIDSEILIIDEVLAVGDAEFQKKCLGKIGEVVKGGRTVLMVSHNLQTVVNLCSRALVLDAGGIICDQKADVAVSSYLSSGGVGAGHVLFDRQESRPGADAEIMRVELLDDKCHAKTSLRTFDSLCFRLDIKCLRAAPQGSVILEIKNSHGLPVVMLETNPSTLQPLGSTGDIVIYCCIEELPLVAGQYSLSVGLAIYGVCVTTWYSDVASLVIASPASFHQNYNSIGVTAVRHRWLRNEFSPVFRFSRELAIDARQFAQDNVR